MKKIMITLVTAAALTLTGCSANSEKPIMDETSSTVESSVTSTTSETKVESETSTNVSKPVVSTTSAASSEKPANSSTVSSAASSEKPVVSSSTTSSTKPITSTTSNVEKPTVSSSTSSTKPVEAPTTSNVEKPTVSSSTSSTKPVEVPVHTHSFAEATCEKPATCTTCGETKGNALGHKYNNGICVYCGRIDLNYFASSYDCDRDGHYYIKGICKYCGEAFNRCENFGHTWGESYTKTYTEDFELVEKGHYVVANGFDITLARRYGCNTEPDFGKIFDCIGLPNSSGTTTVKTTATRTVTDYYRTCSECGFEDYYSDKYDHMYAGDYYKYVTVNDDNWVVVGNVRNKYPIWWDENNIPDKVWKVANKDKQVYENWVNSNYQPELQPDWIIVF